MLSGHTVYTNGAISLGMPASAEGEEKNRRGSRTAVPWWWIQYAERWNRDHGTVKTNAELGVKLAEVLGRPEPFSYVTIGRFWSGKIPTDQIAEALLLLYPDLPPFAVYPGDLEEALEIQAVQRRAESRRRGPRADLGKRRAALASEIVDLATRSTPDRAADDRQSDAVASDHEASKGRSGGAGRRRLGAGRA